MILRIWVVFLTVVLSFLGLVPAAGAQDRPNDKSVIAGSEPPSSFRSEFLDELSFCEQRFILIAEAMPADKYSWRPAPGMRSLGGLFAHVVITNYRAIEALDESQSSQLGPHSSIHPELETILATAEDKPKILQALKDSFVQLRIRVLKLSEADGDKPQALLNRQTTVRGALMIVDRHLGQHLGQAITYVLMNGVVPPWRQERRR